MLPVFAGLCGYPPILPIVYYEDRDEWTAPMDFKSRVNRSDVFGEYIPDFKYYLVPIQKYSNDELLSKEDEISLIMMINKDADIGGCDGVSETSHGKSE